MMIHDGFAVRNIIYMIAVMQTAIAPLAFVYHIYYLTTAQPLFSTHIPIIDSLLDIWLKLELIFYIYFQVTWNRMQSLLPPVKPGVKARRHLFHNTINNISDIDDWITGWFLKPNGHPPCLQEIRRENLAEWYIHRVVIDSLTILTHFLIQGSLGLLCKTFGDSLGRC